MTIYNPTYASKAIRLTMVIALCTLCACQTHSPIKHSPIQDAQMQHALLQSMEDRYPPNFEAVHHSILTVRTRQFRVDGFLRDTESSGTQFLATSGLGNTLFELSWTLEGELTIESNSGSIKDKFISEGPARDIENILHSRPSFSTTLTAPTVDTLALEEVLEDGQVARYLFSAANHQLIAHEIIKRNRVRYKIEYTDYSTSIAEGYTLPSTIKIHNKKRGYSVVIRQVQMKVKADS